MGAYCAGPAQQPGQTLPFLSCLRSVRQAILKRAFEGKPAPQDLSGEPAAILLERILAERAVHQESTPRRPRKLRLAKV